MFYPNFKLLQSFVKPPDFFKEFTLSVFIFMILIKGEHGFKMADVNRHFENNFGFMENLNFSPRT